MTRCVCGNRLSTSPETITVVRRPCRCETPAKPRASSSPLGYVKIGKPDWLPASEADKRRRLGIPLRTPAERSVDD